MSGEDKNVAANVIPNFIPLSMSHKEINFLSSGNITFAKTTESLSIVTEVIH
jgi:hypothetical protein